MSEEDARAARALADRVYLVGEGEPAPVPAIITDALSARRVLRIGYADRHGLVTRRDVEPLAYLSNAERWYLLAWCRLRGAVRAFRTDRITGVTVTAQVPAPRALRHGDLDIPADKLRRLALE
jgi:predicted DNA-binding transcriptional regulator YafY